MKRLGIILATMGIVAAGAASAEVMKNAKVEAGALIVDGRTYTIDTTNKKGQELAAKTGIYNVTGKVDAITMKIVVDNYTVASSNNGYRAPSREY